MKKSRFTESQIIKILKEQESGKKVSDICREHGISQPTLYNWKSKYGGLEVNQLKRLKEMEAELSQYKKIVAEQTLHITVLADTTTRRVRGAAYTLLNSLNSRGIYV
ncbi:transposase [Reichenbachiella agariperforans]|nr:transposase [Reichenbachiella agariperforans]